MQLDPDSDDPPGIVQLRYATRKVDSYWESKPPPQCLHLIAMQVLCTFGESPLLTYLVPTEFICDSTSFQAIKTAFDVIRG